MAEIVPTVLATSPAEYDRMLKRAASLSPRLHVDICDGEFADNQTIGIAQVHVPENTKLDLHLMVKDIGQVIDTALSLHPNLIILHAESEGDVLGELEKVKALGIKVGVAILPQTAIDSVSRLIKSADHVLIFTGELGHNGGEFNSDRLSVVEAVRQLNPDAEISIDGGVNATNAQQIVAAGVDVLYTGGYLQGASDPKQAYKVISAAGAIV